MTVAALVSELRARDVSLSVENGRLRVEGPKDALSAAVLIEIAARKPELLRHLGSRGSGLLAVVRHEHQCRCGRQFRCTAPACAGKSILCVCCKLDDIEARIAGRRSGQAARGHP
jgi:hypothetical protein